MKLTTASIPLVLLAFTSAVPTLYQPSLVHSETAPSTSRATPTTSTTTPSSSL
ncbi:uncharacterized protein M421DRAFT_423907 [Didymella exigua CBS 183.55]|uniref:Uncharacterized protein n=1 Tax=Didymella exigua CBS 183.55 TaxID=1150837 RepID=A0A6A5RCE2_9PLEO|nr:uncharacterized protein M421DRAFT_423907 [Didymella exigua CBS 183.55]KAF1925352.1 hypothetical protein M421DRAFT_423907 [Didymella exigua CBS 183.55]